MSDSLQKIPFTERYNPLSSNLDGSLSASEFLKTLRACDAQIFNGYMNENSLFDTEIVNQMQQTIAQCTATIRDNEGVIVFGGCGTSGRIAYLISVRFNQILKAFKAPKRELFAYTCAGGDSALLLSDELPEDDPMQGLADYHNAVALFKDKYRCTKTIKSFYGGITCGLSAPYCAGPVASILRSSDSSTGVGLIGFNPADLSRDVIITRWPESAENSTPRVVFNTFRDMVIELAERSKQENNRFALINPVLGPEPIAGSSRMKGGSATMVILDALCLRTLGQSQFLDIDSGDDAAFSALVNLPLPDILGLYRCCHGQMYSQSMATLPTLMEFAASSLRKNGRLLYLGCSSAGALGCIDASEMPDTYGAPFDQTRGFVFGGWLGLQNVDGDISGISYLHRIGFHHFEIDIAPTLNENDCVVILLSSPEESCTEIELMSLLKLARICVDNNATLAIACASFLNISELLTHNELWVKLFAMCENKIVFVSLLLPVAINRSDIPLFTSSRHVGFSDFAIKLMTNAISTYAQASGRGAVYRSMMITTGPANDKIYMRCVKMISEHLKVDEDVAEMSIIRSIHGVDELTPELRGMTRANHIRAGVLPVELRHQSQVILPVAFLLASNSSLTVQQARAAVSAEPRISVLLEGVISGAGQKLTPENASISAVSVYPVAPFVGEPYAVGIDLGGTNIRGAAIAVSNGKLLSKVIQRQVHDKSEAGVMDLLGDIFDCIMQSYQDTTVQDGEMSPPVAVGIGQPGCVSEDGGCISGLANYPHWSGSPVNVRSALSGRFGSPVPSRIFAFDDANSALAAELAFGQGRLSKIVAMITVGTGYGTSVAFDGRIINGERGLIEGGHCILGDLSSYLTAGENENDSRSRRCGCGQQDCLEIFCSGARVVYNASQLETRGRINAESSNMTLSVEDVVDAAQKGHFEAERILDNAAKALAFGILNCFRAYDPSIVIVGGSVGRLLLERAICHLRSMTWKIHPDMMDIPILLPSTNEPGILGAANLAIQRMGMLPQTSMLPISLPTLPFLRKAKEADREALYEVCLKTGDAGMDGSHLFSDSMLLGQIYVGPYLTHSKDFAFSLVFDNKPVGYVLGVLNTLAFRQTCKLNWWPKLWERYEPLLPTLQENERELIHAEIVPYARPIPVTDATVDDDADLLAEYPSHLHIDMVASMQGIGFGALMIERLLYSLRMAGSIGVHLCMHVANSRAFHFYTMKLGFHEVKRKGKTELVLARKL